MSEVAGTSPATTRAAALPQSFRSLLLARLCQLGHCGKSSAISDVLCQALRAQLRRSPRAPRGVD
jgi:hypothetical protein